MAIYKIPSGKKLDNKNYDPETLIKNMGAESISESTRIALEKASRSHGDFYVYVDPYDAEICEELVVRGGTNKDEEENSYYLAGEEI